MPTRKQLLITAAIIFIVGSCLPASSVGDFAMARIDFGLPVPWLGIDVRYGQIIPEGNFYRNGNIEKIEGLHVYWAALPFSLTASAVLGAIFVGIGKAVARSARPLFRTRT